MVTLPFDRLSKFYGLWVLDDMRYDVLSLTIIILVEGRKSRKPKT